jgi:hypothetical protein
VFGFVSGEGSRCSVGLAGAAGVFTCSGADGEGAVEIASRSGVVAEGVAGAAADAAGRSRKVFGARSSVDSTGSGVACCGATASGDVGLSFGLRRNLGVSLSAGDEGGTAGGFGVAAGAAGLGAAGAGSVRTRGFRRNGGGDSSLIATRLRNLNA